MHACVHACMQTYMHACMHTQIHKFIHSFIYPYIHTDIHTYIHTHIHEYIHAYIHAYIHTYTHTYMHTHMHACIHIQLVLVYIHIYTVYRYMIYFHDICLRHIPSLWAQARTRSDCNKTSQAGLDNPMLAGFRICICRLSSMNTSCLLYAPTPVKKPVQKPGSSSTSQWWTHKFEVTTGPMTPSKKPLCSLFNTKVSAASTCSSSVERPRCILEQTDYLPKPFSVALFNFWVCYGFWLGYLLQNQKRYYIGRSRHLHTTRMDT